MGNVSINSLIVLTSLTVEEVIIEDLKVVNGIELTRIIVALGNKITAISRAAFVITSTVISTIIAMLQVGDKNLLSTHQVEDLK